jgi:hypothetical protein
VDLFVLIVIIAVGFALFVRSQPTSRPQSQAVQPTTASPTTSAIPRLESSQGLAWIVAACGGPVLIKDLPQTPLPRASESGICLAQPASVPIAIGVYDDGALLESDITDARGITRYATRSDKNHAIWVFLIEGRDAAPLESLQRYGFSLK